MKAPLRKRSEIGFDMTPMIDIVFQLIIFFLVASHFTNQENAMEVELPSAEKANEIQADEISRLTLSIPREGELFVGMKSITNSELSELLKKEGKHQLEKNEPFQLRIRAGRLVPFSGIEPVLLEAAKAGIADVQFAVMEE